MPIYEYECRDCQAIIEEWRSIAERRTAPACRCGGETRLILSSSSPALFFQEGGGGRMIENLGEQPIAIRSPAEHRAAMKKAGVREGGARIGERGCWV